MAEQITPLPIPPTRQDPVNFAARADEFLAALPLFQTEANALALGAEADALFAEQKALEASNFANDALTSANNAAASFDSFDDRYLGAKAEDPLVDNDGQPLLVGALYFNTTINKIKIRNSANTAWIEAFYTDENLTVTNLTVAGTDVLSTQPSLNVFNTTSTTINFAGAATTLTIGATTGTLTLRNANTVVTGDLAANGGDISTTATTFNLLNATATTVNFAGSATALTIGATTGTATIRNASVVLSGDLSVNGGDLNSTATTFNLLNNTVTTLNIGAAATAISVGAVTGTFTINNASAVVTGDLTVNGGDIITNAAAFNLLNTTATNISFAGAATTLTIGATTGTATIRNATVAVTNALTVGTTLGVTGAVTLANDLAVNGGDVTTTATTFNLLNATATTVNFAGAATALTIGATTGTMTLRNATIVGANATQALFNTVATTLNIGGAATAISMGSANTGTFSINNNIVNMTGTGALDVPTGTTAQRPAAPVNGYFRYNTTLNIFEGYVAGAWGAVGGGATGGAGNYVFVENDKAVTANYTIPANKNASSAGPITINNGITVTVSNGARWVIV